MLFLYFLFAIPFGMVPRDLGPFVDMPKANHSISLPGARRDDALIITVLFDGHVSFSAQHLTLDELTIKLKERIKAHAPRTAYIQADARCKYAAVKGVLESIRAAGIEKVAFLTASRGKSSLL